MLIWQKGAKKIEVRFRERLIWENGATKIEVRFRERLILENGAKKQVLQKNNKGSSNNNLFNLKKRAFPRGKENCPY